MDKYIPTTQEIREAFSKQAIPYAKDPHIPIVNEWFDRWLAEVKAQAVAEWQKQHWAEFNKSLALDPYRQGYEDILQSPPLFPEHVGETE